MSWDLRLPVNSKPIRLGCHEQWCGAANGNAHNGLLDEVRLYARALPSEVVQELYLGASPESVVETLVSLEDQTLTVNVGGFGGVELRGRGFHGTGAASGSGRAERRDREPQRSRRAQRRSDAALLGRHAVDPGHDRQRRGSIP